MTILFRLISEKTVEENILKKAQNKRLLGNIAIEGGNFTAAYFKQHSIKELFETCDEKQEETPHSIITRGSKKIDLGKSLSDVKNTIKDSQYEEVYKHLNFNLNFTFVLTSFLV